MSRSGYHDDGSGWDLIKWRGQVASAIRGKRGQQFLRDLIEALEAMPQKRLIRNELRQPDGEVCAIGALGARRGVNLEALNPEEPEPIAETFGIAHQLVQEIEYLNDERYSHVTSEERWQRMHAWAKEHLKPLPQEQP